MGLKLNWYAAKTGANQEFSIQRKLYGLQIQSFAPTIQSIQLKNGEKKCCTKVAIPNIVFVKTDKESAYKVINEYGLKIKYMIDAMTRKTLIIPDKQMEDFMKVMLHYNDADIILSADNFLPGDMVKITSGPFAGIEGILGSRNNRDTVSIHINGIVRISIHLDKDTLIKLK